MTIESKIKAIAEEIIHPIRSAVETAVSDMRAEIAALETRIVELEKTLHQ